MEETECEDFNHLLFKDRSFGEIMEAIAKELGSSALSWIPKATERIS